MTLGGCGSKSASGRLIGAVVKTVNFAKGMECWLFLQRLTTETISITIATTPHPCQSATHPRTNALFVVRIGRLIGIVIEYYRGDFTINIE
jgi:hypothetical protein